MEKLRPARIEDVGGILALIEPLEADGTLVKRSRERLEQEIANFEVIEHDGSILACAALYPFPETTSAELACLAVAPEVRDSGYGERLMLACEARARQARIRRVFALTTRAQHWFIRRIMPGVLRQSLSPEEAAAIFAATPFGSAIQQRLVLDGFLWAVEAEKAGTRANTSSSSRA